MPFGLSKPHLSDLELFEAVVATLRERKDGLDPYGAVSVVKRGLGSRASKPMFCHCMKAVYPHIGLGELVAANVIDLGDEAKAREALDRILAPHWDIKEG